MELGGKDRNLGTGCAARQQGQVIQGTFMKEMSRILASGFSIAEQDDSSYDRSQLINDGKISTSSYLPEHQGTSFQETSFQEHSAQIKFTTGPQVKACHREEMSTFLVSSHVEKN